MDGHQSDAAGANNDQTGIEVDKSQNIPANKNMKKDEPGVAKVKAEFLDVGHVPRLVTDFLPEDAAKELQDITSKYKQEAACKPDTQEGNDTGSNEEPAAPPTKKLKLRGRNKKRPLSKRPDASTKMCPAIVHGTECRFGEKCIFSHDTKSFLAEKPPDLAEKCLIFEKFGRCQYGITCRFGSQHLDADGNNIIDKERYDQSLKKPETYNAIGKDLQMSLRKKKYNFSKSNNLVSAIQKLNKQQAASKTDNVSERPENTNCVNSDPEVSGVNRKIESSGAGSVISTESLSSAGKDIVDILVESVTKETKASIQEPSHHHGCVTDEDLIRLRISEKKKINFADKLYLAPLTTVGNLPFRRICKEFGADITCGEMALATNLLQGQQSEWALLRRHHTEDIFGVQICGGWMDSLTRCAQMLTENINIDFIDLNCGCPIDLVFKKGEGSALMGRANKFEQIIESMSSVMDIPLTVKIRTGIFEDKSIAHNLIPRIRKAGASLVTLHGRSREQRYTKLADWDYIKTCAEVSQPMPLFGNGDILSYEDYNLHREQTKVSGCMIARGALIKPWIFNEIKEQRHWDISANERLDMLRKFVNNGLEHWGSDQQGVETTRRFLLEWLSFLYRYIPVGVLERVPQKINERPPYYFGRNDLETLMASGNSGDWVRISEMLLGPVPSDFTFLPKHKANSYK